MIDDPAILANILLVLFTGLFLVIVWLLVSAVARQIRLSVSRDDELEPETHGDGSWAEYGLTHLDDHPRGRVEISPRQATPAPEIGSGLLAKPAQRAE